MAAHHAPSTTLLCEPTLDDLDSDNTLIRPGLEHDVDAVIQHDSLDSNLHLTSLLAKNSSSKYDESDQLSIKGEDPEPETLSENESPFERCHVHLKSHVSSESPEHVQDCQDELEPQEPRDHLSECPSQESVCQTGCQMRPYYVIHTGHGRPPPPDYEEFECPRPKCQFIFSTSSERDEHVAEVHKPPARVTCDVCQKTFARKYELQIHVKTIHLNIKDNVCPEIGCNYRTAEKGKIKKHLEQKHWGVKNFKCRQCEYKSTSGSSLRNHVKAVHLKLREFKCEYCEYRGAQKNQVQRHMEAIHLNLRQYQCPECDYRANHESTVKTHIKNRHQVVRDHLCPHCGYGTTNKTQLEQHIEKKHRNPKRRKTKPIYVSGYRLKEPLPPNLVQSQMSSSAT
ncbi:zinc finger autosomal protein-like isoform X2 [Tigriopus californicus]|uniref:zinc finger autosomal protein-like isoform X2 n=1 Tax=Tigriopus californicus TaxID=6832 RepID=UPI0027DA668C|nr:zinc finger autosomal protein-like isoform X2 [Tigriopus californicus]